jgi:Tol biopolymer transport system component
VTRRPGDTLLHYRLTEKIGQGAMGSVWRARDTTLDRDAAVKILPAELADDAGFLSRFEREAKLLASLSHPNLAAVFGVHASEGTHFLAMELVPGEDLSERIGRGPLPPGEAARVLSQIAEALGAAHARGVIHRDLKPANVRLLPDGRVKVLDFGLAKTVAPQAPGGEPGSDTASLTATGIVLGTVPYMSPEQARSLPIDARTDIWSFGCVLWECLTGARPFRGGTMPDLVASILHEEPDASILPAATPPGLRRVLRRCLAKDPDRRYHHIADARLDLEEAMADPGGPALDAAPRRRRPRPARLLAAVLGAACLLAIGYLLRPGAKAPAPPPVSPLAGASYDKITGWPGEEFDGAISPDGRFVAFVSNRDGPYEAYQGEIGSGRFQKIDCVSSGNARDLVHNIGFVGDGREVWLGGGFLAGGMKSVPLLSSGPVRDLLDPEAVSASWTKDGRVVYHHGTGGDPLYLARGRGINPKPIPVPTHDGYHQHFPTWSQDGRWIYVTRGYPNSGEIDLWRVHPDGTNLQQLTHDQPLVAYPAPLDDHTVLYVALDEGGDGPWLWWLDLRTLTSHRATIGSRHFATVSASADGRRIVATEMDTRASLYEVPILDHLAAESDVRAHDLPRVRVHAPRLRGASLFYLSSRGSRDGLWRQRGKESKQIWNGKEAALLEPPAISHDGLWCAITIREKTQKRLWRVRVDSGVREVLARDLVPHGTADWSPDDQDVVVGGSLRGQTGLYRIHVADGHADALVTGDAVDPVWSPDGRVIVYSADQVNAYCSLRAIDARTGKRVEGFPTDIRFQVGERARFVPGTGDLIYMQGLEPGQDFHLLDMKTFQRRRLTKLDTSHLMRTFDVTEDGKTIVFDRLDVDADIVMFDRGEAK